jgi:hypothetical protein
MEPALPLGAMCLPAGRIPTALAVLAALVLVTATGVRAGDSVTMNSSNNTSNDMEAFRGFDPTVLTGPADPHPDTSDLMLYEDDPNTPDVYYLNGSTEFGYGLVAGASDRTVCMNRVDCEFKGTEGGFPEGGATTVEGFSHPEAQTGDPGYYYLSYVEDGDDGSGGALFKQGLRNDHLSYPVSDGQDCRTVGAQAGEARCNETDFGFHQEAAMIGPGSAAGGHGDGDQVFDLFFSVDALVDANGDLIGDAKGSYDQSYTDVTNGVSTAKSCSGTFTYSTASGYTQTSGAPYECP